MTERSRVTCPVCGRVVALSPKRRLIAAHVGLPGRQIGRWCEAAGQLTEDDARKADLRRLAALVAAYPDEARELVARLPGPDRFRPRR